MATAPKGKGRRDEDEDKGNRPPPPPSRPAPTPPPPRPAQPRPYNPPTPQRPPSPAPQAPTPPPSTPEPERERDRGRTPQAPARPYTPPALAEPTPPPRYVDDEPEERSRGTRKQDVRSLVQRPQPDENLVRLRAWQEPEQPDTEGFLRHWALNQPERADRRAPDVLLGPYEPPRPAVSFTPAVPGPGRGYGVPAPPQQTFLPIFRQPAPQPQRPPVIASPLPRAEVSRPPTDTSGAPISASTVAGAQTVAAKPPSRVSPESPYGYKYGAGAVQSVADYLDAERRRIREEAAQARLESMSVIPQDIPLPTSGEAAAWLSSASKRAGTWLDTQAARIGQGIQTYGPQHLAGDDAAWAEQTMPGGTLNDWIARSGSYEAARVGHDFRWDQFWNKTEAQLRSEAAEANAVRLAGAGATAGIKPDQPLPTWWQFEGLLGQWKQFRADHPGIANPMQFVGNVVWDALNLGIFAPAKATVTQPFPGGRGYSPGVVYGAYTQGLQQEWNTAAQNVDTDAPWIVRQLQTAANLPLFHDQQAGSEYRNQMMDEAIAASKALIDLPPEERGDLNLAFDTAPYIGLTQGIDALEQHPRNIAEAQAKADALLAQRDALFAAQGPDSPAYQQKALEAAQAGAEVEALLKQNPLDVLQSAMSGADVAMGMLFDIIIDPSNLLDWPMDIWFETGKLAKAKELFAPLTREGVLRRVAEAVGDEMATVIPDLDAATHLPVNFLDDVTEAAAKHGMAAPPQAFLDEVAAASARYQNEIRDAVQAETPLPQAFLDDVAAAAAKHADAAAPYPQGFVDDIVAAAVKRTDDLAYARTGGAATGAPPPAARAAQAAADATQDAGQTAGQTAPRGASKSAEDLRKMPNRPADERVRGLFAKTDEAIASDRVEEALPAVKGLVGDVPDLSVEDARQLVTRWIDDPASLIRGVDARVFTTPALRARAASDGLVHFGDAMLAARIQNYQPILQAARADILAIPELLGRGTLNKGGFMGALEDVLYTRTRRMLGMKNLPDLPTGVNWKNLKRIDVQKVRGKGGAYTGQAQVVYRGRDGTVLHKGEVLSFEAAKAQKADVWKAIREANQPSRILRIASAPMRMQRAIMTDMYLGLSPRNWIRNAASAYAHMFADNVFTLQPLDVITKNLDRKLGEVFGNTRVQQAVGGAQQAGIADVSGRNWSRRFWPNNNPYAWLMEKAISIPYGKKGIRLGGIELPVGEQNFYTRIWGKAFERAFAREWPNTVKMNVVVPLLKQGFDPSFVNHLAQTMIEAGLAGSREDVTRAAKRLITDNVVKPTLKALKVQDGVLEPALQADLINILNEATPANIPQTLVRVHEAFKPYRDNAAKVLAKAPPQPGVTEHTRVTQAQDTAQGILERRTAKERRGVPPQQAVAEATQEAKAVEQRETAAVQSLLNDVSAASPDTRTGDVVDSFVARMEALREQRRIQRDEAYRKAWDGQVQTNAPKAQVYATVEQIYNDIDAAYIKAVEELVTEARLAVNTDAPLEVSAEARGLWQRMEQRLAGFDPQANAAARAGEMQIGDAGTAAAKEIIDAQRDFVDKAFVEMLGAFQRTPTVDALDHMRYANIRAEDVGHVAAIKVRDLFEQARQTGTPEAWAAARAQANEVWRAAAEKQVDIYRAAQTSIEQVSDFDGLRAATTYDAIGEGAEALNAYTPATAKQRRFYITAKKGDTYQVTDYRSGQKYTVGPQDNWYPPQQARAAWDAEAARKAQPPPRPAPAPEPAAPPAPAAPAVSRNTPGFQRMHQLGRDYYGVRGWDEMRPQIVESVTKGRTATSKELTPDEVGAIVRKLEERVKARNAEAIPDAAMVNRAKVRERMVRARRATEAEIDADMALMDANARVWAKYTGQQEDRYYAHFLADVRGGTPVKEARQAGAVVKSPGGAYGQLKDGRGLITLFPTADTTTLVHETWHHFDNVMRQIAKENPDIAADMKRLDAWAAAEGKRLNKAPEEVIAEAGEVYVKEGRAPTPELEGVFAKFKEWLTELYKKYVSHKGPDLDDDVRRIFDRWLDEGSVTPPPSALPESPNEPVFGRTKGGQETMFGSGEDTPLFTGQAPRAPESAPFAPQPVQRQESLIDMRPVMGQKEPSYTPKAVGETEVMREAKRRRDDYITQQIEALTPRREELSRMVVDTSLSHTKRQEAADELKRLESQVDAWGDRYSEMPSQELIDRVRADLNGETVAPPIPTVRGLVDTPGGKGRIVKVTDKGFQVELQKDGTTKFFKRGKVTRDGQPVEVRGSEAAFRAEQETEWGVVREHKWSRDKKNAQIKRAKDQLEDISRYVGWSPDEIVDENIDLLRQVYSADDILALRGRTRDEVLDTIEGAEDAVRGAEQVGAEEFTPRGRYYYQPSRPTMDTVGSDSDNVPHDAVWRHDGIEERVTVLRSLGRGQDGQVYYGIAGRNEGIPDPQVQFAFEMQPGEIDRYPRYQPEATSATPSPPPPGWRDLPPDAPTAPANIRWRSLDGFEGAEWSGPELARDWNTNSRRSARLMNNTDPQMGEAASDTLRRLDEAEQAIRKNLPQWLATPHANQLSPQQKIQALDAVQRAVGQGWDNNVASASYLATQAGDFAMLNYGRQRNIDTLLSLAMPYHYFWSRTAANWVQRFMRKPSLLNLYWEVEKQLQANERQNEMQNLGLPQRAAGRVPVFGEWFAGNPLNLFLPVNSYWANEMVDPETANNDLERAWLYARQWTPVGGWLYGMIGSALSDAVSPREGTSRMSEWGIGDVVPLVAQGSAWWQAATGKIAPNWVSGDPYRIGITAREIADNPNLTKLQKDWAMDVGLQLRDQLAPLAQQPAEAERIWTEAAKQAGLDKAMSLSLAWLLGVPFTKVPENERAAKQAQNTRRTLGYRPEGVGLFGDNAPPLPDRPLVVPFPNHLKQPFPKGVQATPQNAQFVPAGAMPQGDFYLPFQGDYRTSQGFGANPDAYAKFGLAGHNGVDYAVPKGTPILAAGTGKVVEVGDDGDGYGWYVKLQHPDGSQTLYAHLSQIDVKEGQSITATSQLGLSGGVPGEAGAGNTTGAHLHFGYRPKATERGGGYVGYTEPGDRFATRPEGGIPTQTIASTPDAFGKALDFTLGWEAGYTEWPDYLGGPTNKGIIMDTLRSWRAAQGQPPPTVEDLKNISDEEVRAIYEQNYWQASGADELPMPLAAVHFDTAVISGPGKAAELLEQSGGDVQKYLDLREQFHRASPHADEAPGWFNRVDDLRALTSQWQTGGGTAGAPITPGIPVGANGDVRVGPRILRNQGNPYGSNAAKKAFDEQTGSIGISMAQYPTLYPDANAAPDDTRRPGYQALEAMKDEELTDLKAKYEAETNAYYTAHQNEGTKAIKAGLDAIKDKYDADKAAVEQKYGEIPQPQVQGAYKQWSPPEVQQKAYDSAYWAARTTIEAAMPDVPQRPPDGADDAAWNAYGAEWDARNQAIEDEMVRVLTDPNALSMLVNGRVVQPMTEEQARAYAKARMADLSYLPQGAQDLAARQEQVSKWWDEYNGLVKPDGTPDWEARKAFIAAHPGFELEFTKGRWWEGDGRERTYGSWGGSSGGRRSSGYGSAWDSGGTWADLQPVETVMFGERPFLRGNDYGYQRRAGKGRGLPTIPLQQLRTWA